MHGKTESLEYTKQVTIIANFYTLVLHKVISVKKKKK